MIFKKASRDTAETIFVVAQNVSGGTITAGYSVQWDVGASVNGVRVTQPTTAQLGAYAGVMDADTANSAYGLVQVYGYRQTGYIYSSTGSSVAGDLLTVIASEWGLTPAASSATAKNYAFLCAAIAASSSSQFHTTAKIFVRAL